MLDLKFPSNKQAQAKKIKSSIFLLSSCRWVSRRRRQPTTTYYDRRRRTLTLNVCYMSCYMTAYRPLLTSSLTVLHSVYITFNFIFLQKINNNKYHVAAPYKTTSKQHVIENNATTEVTSTFTKTCSIASALLHEFK